MRGEQQNAGMGSIVKWGLLAGGAYLLYRNFTTDSSGGGFSLADLIGAAPAASGAQPAAGAPPAAGVRAPAPAAAPPPPAPTQTAVYQSHDPAPAAAQLAAELTAAAAGDAFLVNGAFNADHWAFYYNRLRAALTPAQMGAAFPGMTETDRGPDMTAAEFVSRLQSAGVAGLGKVGLGGLDAVYVSAPTISRRPGGRPVLVWATRRVDQAPGVNRATPFAHRFQWGHLPVVGGR